MEHRYIAEVILKRDMVPDFDVYPFSLAALHEFDRLPLHRSVTFIVGENGSGKSTLLEAIAVACGLNPEGGTKNFNFSTRSSHSELWRFLRLSKGIRRPKDSYFLRAESFFNLATEIERLDADPMGGSPIGDAYGGRPLHEQSHGESFLALLTQRFRGRGLYILDEPEAALSPSRQLAVLAKIHELVQDDSQFIIATHSPILMAYPEATIYLCGDSGLAEIEYEETEHYQVTKSFLSDRYRFLRHLMDSEDAL